MREINYSHIAIVGFLTVGAFTEQANALPMFSQQTGMECAGCHTQIMPRLNKMGRKFAASGMTLSKKVSDINGTAGSDFISNMDINPSMLIKTKYNKTYDKPDGKGVIDTSEDSTNDGEFSPVRMATFYVGGRITENVGAIVKFGHRKEEGNSIEGKAVYAYPVTDESYLGAVFFSTASLGPFSGMEFYNTGLYKPLRMFDMKIYNNTTQKQKVGAQAASGLQVYYDRDSLFNENDHFFFTAGMYFPAQDSLVYDIGDNLLPFARIAYEYMYGDFNFIVGGFLIKGGDIVSPTEPLHIKKETYGVDFQVEGTIYEHDVTLTATYILKNDVEYSGINSDLDEYDTESRYDEGFSIQGAYSVTDDIIAKASYMHYNDKNEYRKDNLNGTESPAKTTKINVKDLDYAIGLGVDYGFTLIVPMKLAVEYAWMQPSLNRVKKYQDFMVTLTMPF